MPLPLLHAIAGYAVYHVGEKDKADWKAAVGCMALANAADLDFIPGILVGNPDLFHHSLTHSFTAAAVVGLGIAAIGKIWKNWNFLKVFLLSFFSYSTHVALDLIFDHSPHLPVFWPLTPGKLTARIAAFDLEQIHLGGFDNFVCDRFLSLSCLKRFTFEVAAAALTGLCLFIYTGLKKRPVRKLGISLR